MVALNLSGGQSELRVYYSLWKGNEKRFGEPTLYDYTFPVRFPNIVFGATDLKEAKKKIEVINSKIGTMDRFDLNRSKIQRLAIS